MLSPDRLAARQIINDLGSSGQPPEFGVQYFTVGLDPYLSVIRDEYLSSYIPDGGAAFKLVVGIYGGGKTHFLYCIRDVAWANNLAVSFVSLKSSGECPFHRLELVYKAIAAGLLPPGVSATRTLNDAKGIKAFLETWYAQKYQSYRELGKSDAAIRKAIAEDIEALAGQPTTSISFRHAIEGILKAILNDQPSAVDEIAQWLQGEGFIRARHSRYGITEPIDKSTAFKMIRSLSQMVRHLGYGGLVVLLDEAERVPSLSTREREQHLSNLREVIDECGQSTFQGVMIFYAVPDDNFLEGRTQVYEALRQRLSTYFYEFNPFGVRIELERLIEDQVAFLREIGNRIAPIYMLANDVELPEEQTSELIDEVAGWAYEQRYMDDGYKRLFVQKLVGALSYLHRRKEMPNVSEMR